MRCAFAAALCLSLAGCAQAGKFLNDVASGPAQLAAQQDDAKCRSYGASPGDPAYVSCRAQLDAARTASSAAWCQTHGC